MRPSFLTHTYCRGITRITVTVVVIMFELTAMPPPPNWSLTALVTSTTIYTERSALMAEADMQVLETDHGREDVGKSARELKHDDDDRDTKAVSDQFGGGGIADQMIKFNGYPLLENHDHA
jgi:H+/Cl- antiporter ClcA